MSEPILVKHPNLPSQERREQIITLLQNAEVALRMGEAAMTDAVQWAVDIGSVPTAAVWDARQSQLRHSVGMLAVTVADVNFFLSDAAIADALAERQPSNGAVEA